MTFLLLALLFGGPAHAFPEMLRHHYVNCNACHVNPNGGGLLSEYGRGMSGEVLSTWHYEDESLFLHGALKPGKIPAAINVGGDLRALQSHHETRAVREGRYILMQSRLEAAVTAGPLVGDVAYFAPDAQNHIHGELAHFYLLGNLSDTLSVKAGRFLPAFGVNDPHHVLSTRQGLGFGMGMERNAVEAHYSGEQWHAALGASKSRLESRVKDEELAVSAQLEKFFADQYRVGLSFWRGGSELQRRTVASVHGILGFTEHVYLTDETALQFSQPKVGGVIPASAAVTTGVAHFDRLGYELLQGLHISGLADFSRSDVTNPSSFVAMLGGGPVWYPRPHFELELVFTQRRILKTSQNWEDYAWLMFHYYL